MTMLRFLLPIVLLVGCVSPTKTTATSSENEPTTNTAKESATTEKQIVFEAADGTTVDAFEGSLQVPENRSANNSRSLTLKYVRFPATGQQQGSPIVYLAGGPGGSGIETAKHQRFPLFMAMREFGDVIAFDQRGTGASNDLPNCSSSIEINVTSKTSDEEYFETQRAALAECLGFWKSKGIDIHGYNTVENAADLDALRVHLGAEKISLWGISYGTHLSLAAMKQMDQHLDRVIIASVEGLSQTVKLPARSDLYFDRLQAAINTSPTAKENFPDIQKLIGSVLDRLEAEPMQLNIPVQSGEPIPFLLQRRDMQQITAALVADPARASLILNVYRAIDAGDTNFIAGILARGIDPNETTISFRPMSYLMDIASGTSPERRAMVTHQAQTALVGLHMNFSMPLEDVDPSLVLGENFRKPPVSNVPTLVLSGTLDGRTYPQSAQEATIGLTNRQTVTIKNGGHNLFMLSPEVTHTIEEFMRGETVDGREIFIELPDF